MSETENSNDGAQMKSEAAPADSAESLRQHQRVALELEVSMSSENNFYAGITDNISEGGIFVATYTPPARGTEVEMTLNLPGSAPFTLKGIVRWIRDVDQAALGDDTPAGCGIQWIDIPAGAVAAITKFIAARDTMLVDVDDAS